MTRATRWKRSVSDLWERIGEGWQTVTATAVWVAIGLAILAGCGDVPDNHPNYEIHENWCRGNGWVNPADTAPVGTSDPDAP